MVISRHIRGRTSRSMLSCSNRSESEIPLVFGSEVLPPARSTFNIEGSSSVLRSNRGGVRHAVAMGSTPSGGQTGCRAHPRTHITHTPKCRAGEAVRDDEEFSLVLHRHDLPSAEVKQPVEISHSIGAGC